MGTRKAEARPVGRNNAQAAPARERVEPESFFSRRGEAVEEEQRVACWVAEFSEAENTAGREGEDLVVLRGAEGIEGGVGAGAGAAEEGVGGDWVF